MKKYTLISLLFISLNVFGQSNDYEVGLKYYNQENYSKAYTYFLKSANKGETLSQFYLGVMYDYGYGVTQNYNKALEWYLKAANQGNSSAQYNLGLMYANGNGITQDYNKAIKWFQKAADQGDADAQFSLGVMYDEGNGVGQNYKKALEWYLKAANQNHTDAFYNLGNLYENGVGGVQDYTKAIEWYKKAANQGDKEAQNKLGIMYYSGIGVTSDFTKAFEWFLKAAEQGFAESQCNLGLIYANGYGVEQNYNKALEWFYKAAVQNFTEAQFYIGNMFYNGWGVDQDYFKAFEWCQKAAQQGHVKAQANIGWSYANGIGVQQDYQKALEWYKKAADQGDVTALNSLGFMYENGNGVSQDYAKAIKLYEKAAAQGNANAQYSLGILYYNMGGKENYVKALDWYTKSAQQGYTLAMNALGWHYYKGDGFLKDYQKAEEWFKKAIEADDSYPYPYSNLALLYAQRDKNYSEALRYSDMGISRMYDGDQATFYGERGQIYFWQGDIDNAERMLAKCIELEPDFLERDNDFAEMMKSYHSNDVDSKIVTNPTNNKKTFAIIIGNEKYKNNVDVPYANNDAKIFGDYVVKTLGVPQEQVRLVENAGYNDIRMAVNWLTQAMTVCRGKGRAIVYYAGHGIPNETDLSSYLLPVDGIGSDYNSAFSLNELYDKLSSVEAQSVTIFLDACFSGSKREEGMLTSARGVAIKVKQAAPKGNLIVFSAAQGDETAYPYKDKQHGMFTYFLLKKLQESKGEVTLGELGDYLTEEVGRQSFVKNGKMQTPTVNVSSSLQNSWKQMKLK